MPPAPPNKADGRWLAAAALLVGAVIWALAHPYLGIFHDANLYLLQALRRLYPQSLSHDVFLKFGSQDRFTLFSPLYAWAIGYLGVDHAAALLTLLSQTAFLAAAGCLARAAIPRRVALALAAMLVMPLYYGPERIFAGIEDFLTPRLLAEALVLGSIGAELSARRPLAAGLLAAALLLHPVMAAAGAAALMALHLSYPHLRQRPTLVIGAGLLAWMLLAAYAMPAGTWGRFDPQWYALVRHRSPYLFLADWGLDDWGRAAVAVTTLLLGAMSLSAPARALSRAVLIATLTGWMITLLACDGLHLVLFTQLQPWRWQWLGSVCAALLLPAVIHAHWMRDSAGRTTALLLVAAWIFGMDVYALGACALSLVSLLLPRMKPREQRLLGMGAWGLLIVAGVWRLASDLEFTDAHYFDASLPLALRRAMSVSHDGASGIAVIGAMLFLVRNGVRRAIPLVICAASIAALAAVLPYNLRAWTRLEYTAARQQAFEPWRTRIPAEDDVLWTESPASAWVLLNRGSYISGLQTSGLVFSRAAALELERRAQLLKSAVSPAAFLEWRDVGLGLSFSPPQQQGICASRIVPFIVSRADLGFKAEAELSPDPHALKLYRCAP